MAESNAATWITRNATSDNNHISQTLTTKERCGLQSKPAQTRPLINMNNVGNKEP